MIATPSDKQAEQAGAAAKGAASERGLPQRAGAGSHFRLPKAFKPAPSNFTESETKFGTSSSLAANPTTSWLAAKTGQSPPGPGRPTRVRIVR